MQMYVVRVSAYSPYKIEFEYTDRARGFGTAIRRAVEKFRKEPQVKGKHLDNMQINAGRGIGQL